MSATVKLSSALPANDEFNGLDHEHDELLADPKQLRVAVVVYDVPKVVENTDEGVRVPYVRLRRFEPMGPIQDSDPRVRDLVEKAITERTGRTPLPLEDVDSDEDPEL
ncbi:hypothetical protein [uncultured Aeromicrobium sp.]|uniref:hypothetical protein n=1 Tax=uncultured Aeromicrobium sp. TaxID=337820 RepID=UPI0025DDEE9C|nr:hypothetical protein [uncultured Aeromicrobium sp.]